MAILGLIGALLAAVLYGLGTVLQAKGVTGRPWIYAAGLGADGLGFLASLLAVRVLPLFVVESAVASSVAVTALLARWWLHARFTRREVAALAAIGVGLLALAATAREGAGRPVSHQGELLLCWTVVPVLVAGAASYRSRAGWAGPVLATVAGLGFGGTAIAARVLRIHTPWWRTVEEPALWALAAYGVISLVAFGLALARAEATAVAAITFVVETVVPTVVGVTWLGDRVRHGTAPIAVLALALTVGGCVALARFAAPDEGERAPQQVP